MILRHTGNTFFLFRMDASWALNFPFLFIFVRWPHIFRVIKDSSRYDDYQKLPQILIIRINIFIALIRWYWAQHATRMLTRSTQDKRPVIIITMFLQKEAQWSRIVSRDRHYIRCFQSAYGYKSFSILINFENLPRARPVFHLTEVNLKKLLAWRKLKGWETSKSVYYKVLTTKLFF